MNSLSNEEKLLELAKCKVDIIYFAENYCYINDSQTYETSLFKLWDFQKDFVNLTTTQKRIIVLKGRQLGISWTVALVGLHRILFNNNANVLMLSKGETEAQSLVGKSKFMYERLPTWMRDWRPIKGRSGGNKKELEVEKVNSKDEVTHHGKIMALPATEDAGRSETGSLVIADEWAFHPYASKNWGALNPTIARAGDFIGVSTANGLGNFYHQMWIGAENGKNGFLPIFYGYDEHPDVNEQWYEDKKLEYTDQKLFMQENPRSPMEAFISTGGCIFDLAGLQHISEHLAENPMEIEEMVKRDGFLSTLQNDWSEVKVWRVPIKGHDYVIGADPAGGEQGGDFSAAYVIDASSGEQVASIHGLLDPTAFATILANLAERYNNALVGVERNNHGYAVHMSLKNDMNYGRIYMYRKDRSTGDGDNKEGWPTNVKTKTLMESNLQADISQRSLTVHDMDFVYEAQAYVRKHGKTGAEEGMHDDRVAAMGIALMVKENASRQLHSRPQRRSHGKKHFRTRRR